MYTLELTASAPDGKVITRRRVPVLHGEPPPTRVGQNPSPMVEHARAHPRLKDERPPGRREKLSVGALFLPEKLRRDGTVPLVVHFHGGTWLPEVAAANDGRWAVISVQLGSGSGVYARAFADPDAFGRLLHDAQMRAGVQFGPVGLSGWSAGYGAVRAILRTETSYQRIQFVLLIDALHAGYKDGRPGPRESVLVDRDLAVFLKFARDAAAGKKQMLITHSEIFPGTYASTTETADYLLDRLGLVQRATLSWGPMQMQQISESKRGRLRVVGYAGNTAPDHVDQLHALPEFLKWID
jgi:hypothetical protein